MIEAPSAPARAFTEVMLTCCSDTATATSRSRCGRSSERTSIAAVNTVEAPSSHSTSMMRAASPSPLRATALAQSAR